MSKLYVTKKGQRTRQRLSVRRRVDPDVYELGHCQLLGLFLTHSFDLLLELFVICAFEYFFNCRGQEQLVGFQ